MKNKLARRVYISLANTNLIRSMYTDVVEERRLIYTTDASPISNKI